MNHRLMWEEQPCTLCIRYSCQACWLMSVLSRYWSAGGQCNSSAYSKYRQNTLYFLWHIKLENIKDFFGIIYADFWAEMHHDATNSTGRLATRTFVYCIKLTLAKALMVETSCKTLYYWLFPACYNTFPLESQYQVNWAQVYNSSEPLWHHHVRIL